jgi:hypothetical protein
MGAEFLAMTVLRRIPVLIVLASYLFANTLASSWHDHGDCCHVPGGERHHEHGHHDDGDGVDDQDNTDALKVPHNCAVCEFLALAPLPATPVRLIPGGEVVSPTTVCSEPRLPWQVTGAHLPRGPPDVA